MNARAFDVGRTRRGPPAFMWGWGTGAWPIQTGVSPVPPMLHIAWRGLVGGRAYRARTYRYSSRTGVNTSSTFTGSSSATTRSAHVSRDEVDISCLKHLLFRADEESRTSLQHHPPLFVGMRVLIHYCVGLQIDQGKHEAFSRAGGNGYAGKDRMTAKSIRCREVGAHAN